jgi:hypothetical protein
MQWPDKGMGLPKKEKVSSLFSGNGQVTFAQQREKLLLRFKLIQKVQYVLDKLGCLLVVGLTEGESRIIAKFKELSQLFNVGELSAIQSQLLDIEAELRECEKWIEQANGSISAYELRQYIKHARLNREDILSLAHYFGAASSSLTEDRDKFEFLFTELCKEACEEERDLLLLDLLPNPPPLSPVAKGVLEKIGALTERIESIVEFVQLIEDDYLSRARCLKIELGQSFWHPESILAVSALNLSIRTCFNNLLQSERHFIITNCRKLLTAGVSTCKLSNGEIMNVEFAARLAERAEEVLEGNYYNNSQPLQRLSWIGRWMRACSELIDEQIFLQPAQAFAMALPKITNENELMLEPLCMAPKEIGTEEIEQHLNARMEELSQTLKSRPYYLYHKPIQLKYTVLQLSELEVHALISPGNLVESRAQLKQFCSVRRSVALAAELQESISIYNEDLGKRQSRFYFSLPAITYCLKESQQMQLELEFMIQESRQRNDLAVAVDLLSLLNRLEYLFLQGRRIVSELYPTLKMKGMGV